MFASDFWLWDNSRNSKSSLEYRRVNVAWVGYWIGSPPPAFERDRRKKMAAVALAACGKILR
jgi:hypothetical protein